MSWGWRLPVMGLWLCKPTWIQDCLRNQPENNENSRLQHIAKLLDFASKYFWKASAKGGPSQTPEVQRKPLPGIREVRQWAVVLSIYTWDIPATIPGEFEKNANILSFKIWVHFWGIQTKLPNKDGDPMISSIKSEFDLQIGRWNQGERWPNKQKVGIICLHVCVAKPMLQSFHDLW